jgi:hypothetical protein
VDETVEALRRQLFLEHVNAAYATLRTDPRTWMVIERERRAWEATLQDGFAVAEGREPSETRRQRKRSLKRR